MRARSTVRKRTHSGGRSGKFKTDAADVFCRNASDAFGPFGRVFRDPHFQFSRVDIAPRIEPFFVVLISRDDRVAHAERERAVAARMRAQPLVRATAVLLQRTSTATNLAPLSKRPRITRFAA